jgi:hypothetical protein
MDQCNYLLPRHDSHLTPDNECIECLLPQGHEEDHLVKLVSGKYVLWKSNPDWCDCEEENCECFEWFFISDDEANTLLNSLSSKR